MALDKITTDIIADDAVTAAKIVAGAVVADIANDSIDSQHYVAASIDNEHLADDAVGISELSATGTASSTTFLRGDNSWVAAGIAGITSTGATASDTITITGNLKVKGAFMKTLHQSWVLGV